jgi:chromosome segregation ATPase
MAYPNVARQSVSLQARLFNLLVIKANFKQLASNNITTVDELRHRATNYDLIRREDVLNRYVDELADYAYSLEYLQTFVKEMTNSRIANKLLELNRLKEAQFQAKVSEKSSECEALKTEMAHLDLLIKQLKKERLADQAKLAEHEAEISALKEANGVLTGEVNSLNNKVSSLKLKVKGLKQETTSLNKELVTVKAVNAEQSHLIESIQTENAEQYELIEELDSKNLTLTNTVTQLTQDVNKLITALTVEVGNHKQDLTEWAVKLEKNTKAWEHKLEENTKAWAVKLEENTKMWKAELKATNEAWLIKYNEQRKFFEAEIAEVRGRLDNLEAQMKAMKTDTETFRTKVNGLANPVSEETKQEIVRDLANLVALSYSTVSNLQLVDPDYEQRRTWFEVLKEVFKLTKGLPNFGFNVKQHLNFMRMMFKANPC